MITDLCLRSKDTEQPSQEQKLIEHSTVTNTHTQHTQYVLFVNQNHNVYIVNAQNRSYQ